MSRRASPYRDFCLWPYEPAAAADAASADGAALLLLLAEAAGARDAWVGIVAGLQRALGPNQTVWGLKWDGVALSAELYFYDYARLQRRVGLAEARAALDDVLAPGVEVDPAIPYFMVSLDVPMRPAARAPLAAVDVYIGNPGSALSSGLCYRHDAAGAELKNLYFFFDRIRSFEEFEAKIGCSAQVPLGRLDRAVVAPDWLTACRTVVAANKRRADAVYFSGISAAALARFTREFAWPAAIRDALAAELHRFAHLRFDVGFDYALQGGAVVRGKSSLYAVC